ncbi:MAG: GTP-binding protein [Candidatus Micrarchaeia archaeon]
MTIEQQIKEIEDEIARTQYNKATEHHIGLLKAKIARLKEKAASSKKSSGGKGFMVKKEGDATLVMVGFPSVGKSTLINRLTGTKSQVAAWEFTTKDVIPGVLIHKGAKIQILDIPGIIEGAAEGKGMGKMILSTVRAADMIMIVTDPKRYEKIETILDELEKANIRMDKEPPEIKINKKQYGGIVINGKPGLKEETIKDVLKTFGILNADVIIPKQITLDELIDHVSKSCVYLPSLIVLNKADELSENEIKKITEDAKNRLKKDIIVISAEKGINIEKLKDIIYDKLKFIQIYTKRKEGKELGEPMIVKKGTTIKEICQRIHKELLEKFKYALVNGKSVKYPNQRVGLDHVVEDQDIVTIIAEK